METLLRRNVWIEFGLACFLLAFFVLLALRGDAWIEEAIPGTISAAFFPTLVSWIMATLCALLTLFSGRAVRHMLAGRVDRERLELTQGGAEAGRFLALFAYVGILFLYLAGLEYLGFLVSTPPVMLALALLLGARRWLLALAGAIAFSVALDQAAFHLMQIILPQGSLWSWA